MVSCQEIRWFGGSELKSIWNYTTEDWFFLIISIKNSDNSSIICLTLDAFLTSDAATLSATAPQSS